VPRKPRSAGIATISPANVLNGIVKIRAEHPKNRCGRAKVGVAVIVKEGLVDTDELKTRLGGIDLFRGLSKRDLTKLVKSGRVIELADGHEVITEGSGAVGLHLITAGKARVTAGGSVRRTLGVGDYFGEISVLDGQPRSASVEAVGTLRTFMIHPHVVKSLIEEQPDFARQLLILLCSRLREAEKRAG
jgi:CRP/FNR family cyclic AMP-dependent transcriptional regulator